jgi:putative DNA primase/helicase
MKEIENSATIFATGNNVRVRGDMTRRTITSDLDAKAERPEPRTFVGDPVATVLSHGGRYVSAALVIVLAYIAAGCPNAPPPLASFADWSLLVRGALMWLGCADPVSSMDNAREDDPELGELTEMIRAWHDAFGETEMTCSAAIKLSKTTLPVKNEYGDSMQAVGRVVRWRAHAADQRRLPPGPRRRRQRPSVRPEDADFGQR